MKVIQSYIFRATLNFLEKKSKICGFWRLILLVITISATNFLNLAKFLPWSSLDHFLILSILHDCLFLIVNEPKSYSQGQS